MQGNSHRVGFHVQLPANVGVGQVGEVVEAEQLRIALGQVVQGVPQDCGLLILFERLVRAVEVDGFHGLADIAAPTGAVDRCVDGHGLEQGGPAAHVPWRLSQQFLRQVLGDVLRLGRSEMMTGGRRKQALLGDAMEAVIAAVYLDAGFEAARDLVLRLWGERVFQVEADARTTLGDLVFDTVIPRNVRLSEAPSYAMPVLSYDPASRGSEAYRALARELLDRYSARS